MRYYGKKVIALILCVLFLMAFHGETVQAASKTATVRLNVTYGQTEARRMLGLLNQFRTGDEAWVWNDDGKTKTFYPDLEPLTYDYKLEKIAMQRAAELAVLFDHKRPDGTGCFTLFDGYYQLGENIVAAYSSSAEHAMELWKNSESHRQTMLGSMYTAVGVGHAYYNGVHYWVQEFGDPVSNTAATVANNKKTTVKVEIQMEGTVIATNPSSLTISCGKSAKLPQITVQLSGGRACPISSSCKWSVADRRYASVSGNTVKGLTAGATTLTTTVFGKKISVPVTVKPTKTTLSSVKNVKGKKIVVSWKKNTSGSGYQIQYGTSKKFLNSTKPITVAKNSTTSKTITKLTKGKNYYVRIRTYKVVSGKKYYSAWSPVKTVKIKK